MSIDKDPEGNEILTLRKLIDFDLNEALEVGCGDGRLTWRYADLAGHVTGIDPIESEIITARASIPANLMGKVEFHESTLEDFSKTHPNIKFDLAIFSWSL